MQPTLASGFLRTLGLLLVGSALSLVNTPASRAQTFAQPSVVKTGNWPAAIYTADVNRDGIPDLIYVDPGATATQGQAHILLGDGHGGFSAGSSLTIFGPALALGNFIGDGNVTPVALLASAGAGNGCSSSSFQVVAYLLQSSGTTKGTVQSTVCNAGSLAPSPANLLAASLAGGSPPFFVFTDSANSLLYTVNLHGNGSFTSFSIPLPDGVGPVTLADLNGDGNVDLAITANGGVDIFLSNGDGTLQPARRFTSSSPIHSILLKDLTLDGIPDLIAEGANGRIDVFPGNGDGTFQATSIGGTDTLDGLSGNGGHLIAYTTLPNGQPVAFTSTPAGISSLLGQGNAYLGLNGIYNAGPGHTSYLTADFNGDGILDLAVDSPEGIAILYGNADGSLQTSKAYAAGQPALGIATGQLTSSGRLDAVVSTAATQGQVLLGQGDGRLLGPGYPGLPVPSTLQAGPAGLWSQVAIGDFNGDGVADLAFTADGALATLPTTGYGIAVQGGRGDGTFADPIATPVSNQFAQPDPTTCQPPFPHFPGLLFGSSVVADFTGDGLADLANRDSGAFRVLRGNQPYAGSAALPPPTLFWSGSDGTANTSDCNLNAHSRVATADFNSDGRADLIFQSNGSLMVYLTDKTGTPQPLGDLAADGSLTTPGQRTAPDLSSTFGGPSAALGGNYAIGAIAAADLDRDGNPDVLVTYHNTAADPANPSSSTPNFLYLWYGSGGGKFLTSAAHPVNPVRVQLSRNYYQVSVADLNGDGIPDIVLSDGFLVDVQSGVGDGTFGAEQHFLAGQGINGIASGSLRPGTTIPADLLVANGGLTLSNPAANGEILTPNPDVNSGGVTVLLNSATPKTPAPSGIISASPEPSAFESPFTLTATVPGGAGDTVQFTVDGTSVGGTVTVSANGQASIIDTARVLPGSHALTAAVFTPASGSSGLLSPATHVVSRAPTTVTLTPTTPLTVYYGQPVDGSFTVQVIDPANYPYSGNYSLEDNGTDVPACTGLPAHQVCPYGSPNLLDAGPHSFTITYLGDPVNAPAVSTPVAYAVLPDLTTATLTSSANPVAYGSNVTLTASVKGNFAVPNGPVSFLDGASVIGTAALNASGVATLQIATLSAGQHSLTVTYAGTPDFKPASTSGTPLSLQVNPLAQSPASFTLSITPVPVTVGVGRFALLLVKIVPVAGFNQSVTLSCAGLPNEATCNFVQPVIAAGGGSTTLQLLVAAPHDCGAPNQPYFLGENTPPTPLGRELPYGAAAALAGVVALGLRRRRRDDKRLRLLQNMLLLGLVAGALYGMSGCGHCTDLGTRPGSYSFNVTAIAQGGPVAETQTQNIGLTVTIP